VRELTPLLIEDVETQVGTPFASARTKPPVVAARFEVCWYQTHKEYRRRDEDCLYRRVFQKNARGI